MQRMLFSRFAISCVFLVACGRSTIDASEPGPGTGSTIQGNGGTTSAARGPCDIYAAEGGPCVSAHSTVRALLGAYNGPLYQIKKADGTTNDIGVVAPGGFANSATQDAFCGADACVISMIYDQSGRGNHLTPVGSLAEMRKAPLGFQANAMALKLSIGGHTVYGVHIVSGFGYRSNTCNGTAMTDNPETIYMVTSVDDSSNGCCFEYGNVETSDISRDRAGQAEAVYVGNGSTWGKGAGSGPWVMADLGVGMWAGNTNPNNQNTPVTYAYVTAMVKGDKTRANHWTIKAGNAQSGSLTTPFDGPRPDASYNPMNKQGAIILGTDSGDFFEGLMTAHYSSNAADDAVQANIVTAGYGQ